MEKGGPCNFGQNVTCGFSLVSTFILDTERKSVYFRASFMEGHANYITEVFRPRCKRVIGHFVPSLLNGMTVFLLPS